MTDKLWFKRRKYGWGWTPSTKEGLTITVLHLYFIIVFALQKNYIMMFIVISILIFISYKKGPKPKWSWGE